MKRYIILGVIAAIGIAAAVMITLNPAEPVDVVITQDDNGEIAVIPAETAPAEEAEAVTDSAPVRFSEPAAFYSENIEVALSADEG
ncbi:MAG: hypothetical protein ACI4J8_06875, partial [Oscillospiraceae bacterium]